MLTPIFNPFKNRDLKEVWEEVRRNKNADYKGGGHQIDAGGFLQIFKKVAYMESEPKFTNPFAGDKDKREVWTELLKKSKPISREDFMAYVKSKKKGK